jgi:DNA-binding transcriptional LysR family regulator
LEKALHYDLVDLRLFVLIVDLGGFAAAARQANLSVSALSERIRRMEESAGVPFLERSARGSKPTRAGAELAGHARAILLQAERLNGTAAAWKNSEKGLIKLLANSNALTSFLPDVLASFLARHRDVVVDLHEDTSDEIGRAVRAGEADLGIAAGNARLESLELRPFRVDRLILLIPAGHRLSGRKSVGFDQLLDEDFIGLDKQSAIHAYLGQQALRLGCKLTVRIRLRSFEGVCRMVAAGAGVAILPESAVSASAIKAETEVVQLTDTWAERELVICLPKDRPVSSLVELLVIEIAQQPVDRWAELAAAAGRFRSDGHGIDGSQAPPPRLRLI